LTIFSSICFSHKLFSFYFNRSAILAKEKLHGFKFHANDKGLQVGYDKDGNHVWLDKNKRKTRKEAKFRYYCAACGEEVVVLHVPLSDLPIRSSNKSSVVDLETQISISYLQPGPCKMIKKEKGIEKQYSHICPSCEIRIAYRPVEGLASTPKCKYLYLYENSLKNTTFSSSNTEHFVQSAEERKSKT
jgi:ribosomal protein L37AE/L43A